jgi:Protein of unknown function (DUF3396)
MQCPRFRCPDENGRLFASDAWAMCFYIDRPHKRIAPAVLRAIELFRERIRPFQFEWYDTFEGQAAPLDDSIWKRLREKMLGPDAGGGIGLLDPSKKVEGFEVDYRGLPLPLPWPGRENDVSVLYLNLPTEYLEERGPKQVRTLALDLAEELPFSTGYVDFAFNNTYWAQETTDLIRTRYPGVHLDANKVDFKVSTRVNGVHWLNFLGQPVLGQLGGVAGLRECLPPGIHLHDMGGDRVLLTLGDHPDVGDVEAGHTFPLHRALARLLAPYLYHRARPLGPMSMEETLRWERRFLD